MPRYMIHFGCIWHMFVFISVVVTVWGYVGMFVVWRLLLKIVSFEPCGVEVLLYNFVRDVRNVVSSVCILTRGAVGALVRGV